METFNPPILKTERLILNGILQEDQTNIYKGLSHPEVIKYYGVSYSNLEDIEEQMNWYSNLEKSNSGMWWAIRLNDTEEFRGAIGFNDYHKKYRKAEIGFWLLPEYWGKGFIKEAGETVIEYLFDDLKVHRVEAFVESENVNSSKLLKKLNFKHEGRMQDYEVKDDEYISVDLFARLNPKN